MRRAKSYTVFGLIIGATIALAAWSQEWFTFQVTEGIGPDHVAVSGIQVTGAVSAIAVGLLSAAGVLLIAAVIWRHAISIISLGLSVLGIVFVSQSLSDPVLTSVGPLSLATGVSNAGSINTLVTSTSLSMWPTITIVGFALTFVASGFGLGTAWAWSTAPQRFNRPENQSRKAQRVAHNYSDGEAWDELSHGADPTRSH